MKLNVISLGRFVFNNYPGEWEKRRGGRYAWNYLLFFIHLLDKDPEEYNGLENSVADSYKHNRIDFLPIEMCAPPPRCRVLCSAVALAPPPMRVQDETMVGLQVLRETARAASGQAG